MYGPEKFLYYINNGLAAYAGYEILNPEIGETFIVSTASGATGLILCELLKKKKKSKIIGLTSERKIKELKKFVDIAVDYSKKEELLKILK